MKPLAIFSLLVLSVVTLAAQEPSPSPSPKLPPLPPPPLLHPAPDQAQWTMSFDVAPTADAMPTATPKRGNDAGGKKSFPHKITVIKSKVVKSRVVKSGKIFEEIETDTEGKQWEKWNVDNQQVSFLNGSDKWLLTNGGDPGMFFTDYARSDFPELLWIAAKNYVAFTKIGGMDCYVFHDKIVLPGGRDPVDVTAAVDSTTQWPVYFNVDGWKRTYQFGPPPETPLAVPDNVQAILSQREKALAPLLRRPGQP